MTVFTAQHISSYQQNIRGFFVDYSVQNTLLSFTLVMTAYTRRNRNRSSLRSRRHNAGGKKETQQETQKETQKVNSLSSYLPEYLKKVFSGWTFGKKTDAQKVQTFFEAFLKLPKSVQKTIIEQFQGQGIIRSYSERRRSSNDNKSMLTLQNGVTFIATVLALGLAGKSAIDTKKINTLQRQESENREREKQERIELNKRLTNYLQQVIDGIDDKDWEKKRHKIAEMKQIFGKFPGLDLENKLSTLKIP